MIAVFNETCCEPLLARKGKCEDFIVLMRGKRGELFEVKVGPLLLDIFELPDAIRKSGEKP